MNATREHTPTPQELNKTFESLTKIQKLQLEVLMNMFTVLLVSMHQASKTEVLVLNQTKTNTGRGETE